MKILFIAPIPPPIDGQSKSSKVLLDFLLEKNYDLNVINLNKNGLKNGFSSLKRVLDIFIILSKIWKKRKNNDLIYLSLAESFLGNIRDLFIYSICYKSRQRIFIHMLGGAGMKKILEGKGFQQTVNAFFIKRLAGVIVESSVNFQFFSKVINLEKIHIVSNFAEDFLFVNDQEIKTKFLDKKIIKILYLSNLLPGKGYNELADAYIQLQEVSKKNVNIVFVGGFESQKSENEFLSKIENHNGLKYLGKFIDGEKKRELYCHSHVFCLPTYYPFEGQPISILEAYATGCVVITSNHSGIPSIFSDKVNGFMVEKKSVRSIKNAIENILEYKNHLEEIAFHNRNEALAKYRTSIYQRNLIEIFNDFLKR